MTFGKWRQQLRLLQALRLLAAGRPVTAVALEVGYDSASAFIAMFRRTLGTTPRRSFAACADGPRSDESSARQRQAGAKRDGDAPRDSERRARNAGPA